MNKIIMVRRFCYPFQKSFLYSNLKLPFPFQYLTLRAIITTDVNGQINCCSLLLVANMVEVREDHPTGNF